MPRVLEVHEVYTLAGQCISRLQLLWTGSVKPNTKPLGYGTKRVTTSHRQQGPQHSTSCTIGPLVSPHSCKTSRKHQWLRCSRGCDHTSQWVYHANQWVFNTTQWVSAPLAKRGASRLAVQEGTTAATLLVQAVQAHLGGGATKVAPLLRQKQGLRHLCAFLQSLSSASSRRGAPPWLSTNLRPI